MARCKHGVFLPESTKYGAEDVCSICKGLPDYSRVTTVLISTPSTREALDIVDTLHDSDYSEGELDAAKGQLMCFLASVTDESEEYYSEFSLAQLKRLTEKTDAVREFLYSKDSEEDPRWVESEGLDELE